MSLLKQIAIVVVLAGVAAGLSFAFHPNRPALYMAEELPEEGEITVKEAMELAAKEGVMWVDARRQAEFEKGHIPGAIPLNEYDWADQIVAAATALNENQDKMIVVYCDAQKCTASKTIAEKVKEFYPDPDKIKVLRGGWPAWQAQAK
jgi:rhodanese-related sulfurtransferase